MSRIDKLIQKLKSKPTPENFTWSELSKLLTSFGYELRQGSGSRVKFIKGKSPASIISLHKPHPGPNVDRGALNDVLVALIERGEITND